jgi:predicted membrane channel-forming protein YqfA (hemolysin III family)
MRINRAAHIPWAIFVLAASAVAGLLYLAQFDPLRVPPAFRFFGEKPLEHGTIGGTPLGLIFGAVTLGIFVFAALLGVRKKWPILPIGNVQRWLRGHIWLTLLTVPLILLHSGFHLGGPMTTLLMALYAVVMLSGVYGLVLQHRMPTLMKDRLPAEIVFDQIPNIRAQLCASAKRLQQTYTSGETRRSNERGPVATADAELVAGADSERVLSRFIEHQLLPYLRARRGEKFRLGHAREADDTFRHLQLQVAAPYRVRVEEMQGWCNERRLLDEQTRMQHWLHGWLLVHVPVSFLLLLLTAWHAFVTLFHY